MGWFKRKCTCEVPSIEPMKDLIKLKQYGGDTKEFVVVRWQYDGHTNVHTVELHDRVSFYWYASKMALE